MIENQHPILKALEESEFVFHLVGSRYVGTFDRDKSDYDYLMVVPSDDWYSKGKRWLEDNEFKPECSLGYGPDSQLHDSCVWTKEIEGWPKVDVLPMTQECAQFRLEFFRAMKEEGDRAGGLLALALKQGKAWAYLWQVLSGLKK